MPAWRPRCGRAVPRLVPLSAPGRPDLWPGDRRRCAAARAEGRGGADRPVRRARTIRRARARRRRSRPPTARSTRGSTTSRRSTTTASCARSAASSRRRSAPTPSRPRARRRWPSSSTASDPRPARARCRGARSGSIRPRVEGIHLRAGPIARGGLRWSDRRDDFRTEILGLMKAQRVKNAVIVPTGAKGGFYPKQLPARRRAAMPGWPKAPRATASSSARCCRSPTISSRARSCIPTGVIVRDGDDPYFVVAADKGTATFSDVANAIALEHGFWLGDAFASRRQPGLRPQGDGRSPPRARGSRSSATSPSSASTCRPQPIRVVGCGDMSGDVFGNGMLLSKTLKVSRRSTIAISSSIPIPIRRRAGRNARGCSRCRARAGRIMTRR